MADIHRILTALVLEIHNREHDHLTDENLYELKKAAIKTAEEQIKAQQRERAEKLERELVMNRYLFQAMIEDWPKAVDIPALQLRVAIINDLGIAELEAEGD